ncbi:cysteine ABC transporter [Angustibacter sp. Root456]|nr:cysteine ABC transporter [Angustibacter sp. Root456]
MGAALVAGLALTGCGGSGQDGSAAGTASASGPAGSLPDGTLVKAGELSFCADISAPPLTFYDPSQKPVGAEIELGDALAKSLGLTAAWKNTAFAGIIPALQGKQCDAILSQLFIKPEREKVVDFVPYMYSSGALMVKAADDKGIGGLDTTCGHRVAAQTGTTVASFLQEASKTCTSQGKQKVDIRLFAKDSDALQQLSVGLVDAYGTTVETAGYVMTQKPGEYKTVGKPYGQIKTGIATIKGNTALHDAIAKALASVHQDGTYDSILKKWNLTDDALSS